MTDDRVTELGALVIKAAKEVTLAYGGVNKNAPEGHFSSLISVAPSGRSAAGWRRKRLIRSTVGAIAHAKTLLAPVGVDIFHMAVLIRICSARQ